MNRATTFPDFWTWHLPSSQWTVWYSACGVPTKCHKWISTYTNCMQLNYCQLLMWSQLANREAVSAATELVKFIPVLDAVICIAEVSKQLSPQTVPRGFQKAVLSTNYLNNEEAN